MVSGAQEVSAGDTGWEHLYRRTENLELEDPGLGWDYELKEEAARPKRNETLVSGETQRRARAQSGRKGTRRAGSARSAPVPIRPGDHCPDHVCGRTSEHQGTRTF